MLNFTKIRGWKHANIYIMSLLWSLFSPYPKKMVWFYTLSYKLLSLKSGYVMSSKKKFLKTKGKKKKKPWVFVDGRESTERSRSKTSGKHECFGLTVSSSALAALVSSLHLGHGWGITAERFILWRLEAWPRVERINSENSSLEAELESARFLWLWKSTSDYTKSWLSY